MLQSMIQICFCSLDLYKLEMAQQENHNYSLKFSLYQQGMAVVDMESQDSYFQIFSISFYSGVFLKGSARVHLNPRMFLTLVSKLKHDFPHLKCKTSRKIVSSITFSSSILKK